MYIKASAADLTVSFFLACWISFELLPASLQGPYTGNELLSLLRVGVLTQGSVVHHPKHGSLPLPEALALPEPLSAVLLRERAQRAQQAQQAEQGQQAQQQAAGPGQMFWELAQKKPGPAAPAQQQGPQQGQQPQRPAPPPRGGTPQGGRGRENGRRVDGQDSRAGERRRRGEDRDRDRDRDKNRDREKDRERDRGGDPRR